MSIRENKNRGRREKGRGGWEERDGEEGREGKKEEKRNEEKKGRGGERREKRERERTEERAGMASEPCLGLSQMFPLTEIIVQ